MALMSDGAIVIGLCGEKAYKVQAPTLAVIDEDTEYVNLEDYSVMAMDYDRNTNRVFFSAFDPGGEPDGDVIVWDYDTGEYEIINTGIRNLRIVKFLDGKLYASTQRNNKLYVIEID
jgi:outer membrane protein assembly factor BamB